MKITILFVLLTTSFSLVGQNNWFVDNQPQELGDVHWLRNYDEALAKSESQGLPVFILFQEVPGCHTCTTYGNKILQHPFIVELIESHFVPLAIFNNKGGEDRKVLQKYKEPTWNNPVVRITNQKGDNLINRIAGDYSLLGLAKGIKQAMILSGQTTPAYLDIFLEELEGQGQEEEAFLSMYCFWTGEKEIAKIDGVLSTEAGFMHGREVVKVTYNGDKTNLDQIAKKAEKVSCADQVYANQKGKIVDKGVGKYRQDREVKYYLSKSSFRSIPMTPLQSARVNSAIGQRKDALQFLSPRQIELMNHVSNENRIGEDFVSSWLQVVKSQRS